MPAWTYTQLRAADAALVISDPVASATALNAQTVVLPIQDLRWSQIRDVLMNSFDWGALVQCVNTAPAGTLPGGGTQTAAAQSAAIAIHECCIYGGTFAASVTASWNKLVAAAGLLTPAAVGGISSASASAVVALRTPTVPVWEPPVTSNDVLTARIIP